MQMNFALVAAQGSGGRGNDSRCIDWREVSQFNNSAAVTIDCAMSATFLFSFIAVRRMSA